jgi:two-component system phosphate regulon response regulator PhoB
MLPGIDGDQVVRRLRSDERTRDLVVVALTALTSQHAESTAMAAGCDAFLSKPVTPTALVGELVRQLARRSDARASAPDLSRLVPR